MGYEVFEPGQVDAFILLLWSIGILAATLALGVFVLVYLAGWTPRKVRRKMKSPPRNPSYDASGP